MSLGLRPQNTYVGLRTPMLVSLRGIWTSICVQLLILLIVLVLLLVVADS